MHKLTCSVSLRAKAVVVVMLVVFMAAFLPKEAVAEEWNAAGFQTETNVVETHTMYRMYNPNSGEHFYTASSRERDSLVNAGWNYEGEAWTAPVYSSEPVYRLYSGTDHHYTLSASEKDRLVRVGWAFEGIGWYSDEGKGIPLYRQFNPNVNPGAARNNSGSHNYTTSKAENDHLVRLGWREEGIAWYGVVKPSDSEGSSQADVIRQDNVVEVSPSTYTEKGDDISVTGDIASNIENGTVLLLAPKPSNPTGSAVKVISTDKKGSTLTASTTKADFSDVVKTMQVSGSTNSVASFESDTEEVQAETFSSAIAPRSGLDLGTKTFKPIDGMTVTIKPSIDYEFDYSWGKLNKCKLVANVNANFDYEWSYSTDKSVKLFSSTFNTPVAGLYIDADFYLVLHASGEVDIEAKLTANAGFSFDGKRVSPVSGNSFSYEAYFDAQVGAGFKPDLCLKYFGIGIADVAPEAGVTVEGQMNQHGTELTCADLSAWIYVDLYVGKGDTVLGLAMDLVGVEKTYHPVTKANSKVWRIHSENGKVVGECTWLSRPQGDGQGGTIPELEDNGYGEVPILDNLTGASGYCNKLVEPFNIPAGKTVTIGGSGHTSVAFAYDCDPGTVFRLVKAQWDGTVITDDVNAFTSSGRPWHGDYVWTVEVLCGRVVVDDITGWSPPPVSVGECQAIDYPLRISDSTLTIREGKTYAFASENDFETLVGSVQTPQWRVDDSSIASIDWETGVLTAQNKGTTTVKATIHGYTRICKVTVI